MEKKGVLIVDDSKLTQKQLSKILEKCGFTIVDYAANGIEAIEKYKRYEDKIDLITLDITMPMLDGIGVLRKVLSINRHINIIMVSALGKDDVIKECLMYGAKSFIIKPFQAEKVEEIIKSVC